jgi:ribosomal protein L7Ae-like RNA K-turn-binding protein
LYYQIELVRVPNREILGMAIGKSERVVVAVTDEGFAKKVKQLLDSESRR